MAPKRIAIVGATGAVGMELLKVLEQRNFPMKTLSLFASARSKGKKLNCKGENIAVQELTASSFKGIDTAFFCAGASVSRQFAPIAVKNDCVVIDKSSAFRMNKDVPLVVPEVNPHAIALHKGIIASPNCSTIQMVVALKPLHDYSRIKRLIATTFQSVSGAGARAIEEMKSETLAILAGKPFNRSIFKHQIAFNAIPQIDVFGEDAYTGEETKMSEETKKIMEDDAMKISATCVRIPVFRSHSESINVEFEKELTAEKARKLFAKAPGIELQDDVSRQIYPLATIAANKDLVYVGRLRRDNTVKYGLAMWVVSDNVRKGAALNAVQILENLKI
ncbi:MAG: aspartate-semialdehyde dehydrogenase [Planctomycetes bacterium]|nr:aspartate-semialdehyde dehydrogenase [Planctomycetota bacterium]